MSRLATPEELAAARALAQELARREGELTMPLDVLLERFGVSRFTAASRVRLGKALRSQRLTATPPIRNVKRGELITLTTPAGRSKNVTPPPSPVDGESSPRSPHAESVTATEQELAVGRKCAQDTAARGGRSTMLVDALLEAFGVRLFSVAARGRLAHALEAAGVVTSPSIREVRRGESITLTTRTRSQAPPPAGAHLHRDRPWYRRRGVLIGIALFLLVGGIASTLGSARSPKNVAATTATATSTSTPTSTPQDPAAARAAALAEADQALEEDDFPAVLAALAVLDAPDVVDRYNRRISRRILRGARRSLRSGSYSRARREARSARTYQRTQAASAIMVSANTGLAAQRARKRARARAARLARDQRTCSSSEKQTVRYQGGVPAGCTDYSVQLADRRAAREAERAAEELEAAIPEVEAPSSDSGGGSGNWCGASRDGDGDGIWCEGE